MAAMTDNAIVIASPQGLEWTYSLYNADVTGCEELLEASTGKCHYVKRILIKCATAATISVGSGETSSSLTATYLGPIPFGTSGDTFYLDFGLNRAMKIPVSTALTIDGVGTTPAVFVYIEGTTG